MIRKLQKRFIRIAVLVLTAAMVLVAGIVNTANLISVRNELQGTLSMLAEYNLPAKGSQPAEGGIPAESSIPAEGSQPAEGSMPSEGSLPAEGGIPAEGNMPAEGGTQAEDGIPAEGSLPAVSERSGDSWKPDVAAAFFWAERSRHDRNLMNESNWFTVHYNADGEFRNQNLSRMGDMDEETSMTLAGQALASGKDSGWIQDYCFLVRDNGSRGKTVIMLNCETRMTAVRTLALISALACAGGILLSWLLVTVFSRKAVEPTIRNMEQQKQFITNASHELKTPLTVISTNMELLKTEVPENPWVRSTQKQTAALRKLVDELVYLSRMEEEHYVLASETLSPGPMLRETAEPFQAMAEFNGKEMEVQADDTLRMTGDRPSVQRLMSTLCDNAVKYTPEGGRILAEAVPEGKHAVIRVSNTVEKPLTKEQCAQLFNRFYRTDPSRSKEKQGGFGIGLAIAAAIAEKHGGSIEARMDGEMLVISAKLPKE